MDVVLWNSGPANTRHLPSKLDYIVFRTLGPYKISHATRNAGYTSQVIDHINWMNEDELYNCTSKFIDNETAILGISTTFLMADTHELPVHVLNVLHRLTEQFPNLHIVFGGYQARDPALRNVIKCKFSIILEYGEDSFVELLEHRKGKGKLPPFTLISKPWGDFKVFKTPLVQKFDIEKDDHMFTDQDCILPNETLPIEISRGCIFKCKFCNHLMLGRGKLDYLRSMDCIKKELIHNYEKWKITNYYVICDTFNDTEYKMQEWHKMVTSLPFKIQYTAYLRADLLDRYPDVPYLLKDSGLISCYHGIESFGSGAQAVGKGWGSKKAKDYLPKLYHDIWGGEVLQTLSFIVGLPGDTRETFIETLDWFEKNNMHHIAIHNLGINNNKFNKHLSEFDLNAENYGYTFPRPERPWVWKNDYWDHDQVDIFINEQYPRINKMSSWYGSWIVLMLMQHGFDKSFFKKEISRTVFTLGQLNHLAKGQIQTYIKKLLAL